MTIESRVVGRFEVTVDGKEGEEEECGPTPLLY